MGRAEVAGLLKVVVGEVKSITTALLVLHRSSTGYHSEILFCKSFPAQFHTHRHQSPCQRVLLEPLALCLQPAVWGTLAAMGLPPGQGGHAISENNASIASKKIVM